MKQVLTMTRILTLLAVCIVAMQWMPSSASAETRGGIGDRIATQHEQIIDHVRQGLISPQQAAWLKRQHRTVRIQAEIFARGQRLNGPERVLLSGKLNEINDALVAYVAMNKRNGSTTVAHLSQ